MVIVGKGVLMPRLTLTQTQDAEDKRIDMVAAEDAKSLLIIENTPAMPDFIVAAVNEDPMAALSVLELTRIEMPEDL